MPPTPKAEPPADVAVIDATELTDEQFAQLDVDTRIERIRDLAQRAYAQALAIAEEAGELLGDLSGRVKTLEDSPENMESVLARLDRLERNVTLPREKDPAVVLPTLCGECGAPDGHHFDHCSSYVVSPLEARRIAAEQARAAAVGDPS